MIILINFIILFFSPVRAEYVGAPTNCGRYEIAGIVEKNKDGIGYLYKVNKGTMSEHNLIISQEIEPKVVSYIDRPSKIKAKLLMKFDGTKGEISNIEEISMRIPNPLEPMNDNGFKFLSKESCIK